MCNYIVIIIFIMGFGEFFLSIFFFLLFLNGMQCTCAFIHMQVSEGNHIFFWASSVATGDWSQNCLFAPLSLFPKNSNEFLKS